MSTASLQPRSRALVLADAIPGARARDAALVLGGALLVALFAQIQFPVPGSPVPISGQTLAVVVVGASLGARRGAASLALYALLGLALPFYADGGSGLDVIWGATGGYIVGFIVAAYLVGRAAELGADRRPVLAVVTFALAQLVVFAIGVPWLMVAANLDLAAGLAAGFTPFIVGGIVKAIIAGVVTPSAWSLVRKLDRED